MERDVQGRMGYRDPHEHTDYAEIARDCVLLDVDG